MSNSIKDSAQAFAVNQVLKYVDSNPQEAFPKLLDWADKFDKDNLYLTQRQQIRKVMEQPDSNWMRLINSLWTDIDSEVRKVFFRNFIVNASLLGSRKQVANREKYGCNIPWAILMDPTSACNLHCTGCWAAEYGNKLNLSYEELDDIINQAMNWEPICSSTPAVNLWYARTICSACVKRILTAYSLPLPTVPLSMRSLPMRCCG